MVFAVYGSVLSLRFIVSWVTVATCDFIITGGQLFVKKLVDLLENRKKWPLRSALRGEAGHAPHLPPAEKQQRVNKW